MPLLILLRHGRSFWNPDPDRPPNTWLYAGAVCASSLLILLFIYFILNLSSSSWIESDFLLG
jgi:hypothetical protein